MQTEFGRGWLHIQLMMLLINLRKRPPNMTKPRMIATSAIHPDKALGQKSHPNVFRGHPNDGRGAGRASHRRVHGWRYDPQPYRAEFLDRWAALICHLFVTRENVAAVLGVTFQTACNWWDGFNWHSGVCVALAAVTWPDEFARFMGEG